jgi:DNA-binding transcriptional MocR family regulator
MSVTSLKKKLPKKTSKKIAEVGPLASVFPCSESKILDHVVAMKDYDYSISDISKISGVGFKTTLNVVHKLEEQGILERTRQIGNAILYKLNSDSPQARSISRLAFDIAKKRIRAPNPRG